MIQYVRNASFKYVKDIYQRLNKKDAHFVNPRGRFIDSPNVQIRYVAFDDETNRAIGFIDGYVFEEDPGTVILVMAVLPEYRKRYIAIELLNYAERAARSEGFWRLFARAESDNIPSIQMMKKFGFNYERKPDPLDTQIRMHKILQKGTKCMDRFQSIMADSAMEGFFNKKKKITSSTSSSSGGTYEEKVKKFADMYPSDARKDMFGIAHNAAVRAINSISDKTLKPLIEVLDIGRNGNFIKGEIYIALLVNYEVDSYAKALGSTSDSSLKETEKKKINDAIRSVKKAVIDTMAKSKYASSCKFVMDHDSYDISIILELTGSSDSQKNAGGNISLTEREAIVKYFIAAARKGIAAVSDKTIAKGFFLISPNETDTANFIDGEKNHFNIFEFSTDAFDGTDLKFNKNDREMYNRIAKAENEITAVIQTAIKQAKFNCEIKFDVDGVYDAHGYISIGSAKKAMDSFTKFQSALTGATEAENAMEGLFFNKKKPNNAAAVSLTIDQKLEIFPEAERRKFINYILRAVREGLNMATPNFKKAAEIKSIGDMDEFISGTDDYVMLLFIDLWDYAKLYGKSAREIESGDPEDDEYWKCIDKVSSAVKNAVNKYPNLPVSCRVIDDDGDWDDGGVSIKISYQKPSSDSFIKMQKSVQIAIEAEIAKATDGGTDVKVTSSIKPKFKVADVKINGAFKAFVAKLRNIFRSKKDEARNEPATELFGMKKKSKDGHAAMREAVQWMMSHEKEIMSHNDDKGVVIGPYDQEKASQDFINAIGLFVKAKETIQEQGANFGALSFSTNKNGKHVILGFTYDPSDFRIMTSIMYIEVMLSEPLSKIGGEGVKEFDLSIMGYLLWSIEDPDAPIGSKKVVVSVGSVHFSAN